VTIHLPKHLLQHLVVRAAWAPQPCLLHEDIHEPSGACMLAYMAWTVTHEHLSGESARDAYAWQVEQRMLVNLAREHAPHLFPDEDQDEVGALAATA
jgi:hypothetical protein